MNYIDVRKELMGQGKAKHMLDEIKPYITDGININGVHYWYNDIIASKTVEYKYGEHHVLFKQIDFELAIRKKSLMCFKNRHILVAIIYMIDHYPSIDIVREDDSIVCGVCEHERFILHHTCKKCCKSYGYSPSDTEYIYNKIIK